MKIYLDYNLFVELHKNRNPYLHRKVSELSERIIFPYSPAHVEEVATSVARLSPEGHMALTPEASEKLDGISKISNDVELFPARSGPIRVIHESPHTCFERVIKHYDKNAVVELNEANMLAKLKELDPEGSIAIEVSNLPEDFLLREPYLTGIKNKLWYDLDLAQKRLACGVVGFTWKEISGHFPVLERSLELAMNYFEAVRYKPEDVKKSRSRMHDVTHCIYATACSAFVTNDRRLSHKARALYRFFGAPTDVVLLDQFLAADYAPRV